jgi:hypothetical protein
MELPIMTDESRIDEEYEPEGIDPDDPIETVPRKPHPPDDVNPADWLDQEREEPLEDERADGGDPGD